MLILRQPRIFDVDVLGPAVAVALTLSLWLGVIRPLEARINQEQTECQTIDQQKSDAQTQLEQLHQREQSLSNLAILVKHHQSVLHQYPGEDQVIARLDGLLAQHRLQWNALTPIGHYAHPGFLRWDVQMQLSGPSKAVPAFLQELTQKMPFNKCRTLSIIHHNSAGVCEITMDLEIFGPPRGGY